jgi:hypothetical protein
VDLPEQRTRDGQLDGDHGLEELNGHAPPVSMDELCPCPVRLLMSDIVEKAL